jgi:AAA15 family ATPase/GTPase
MKLLYMALMLIDNEFHDGNSGILAIDEPETSLHPAWIEVFGKWILEHNFDKQIFISTHSPELLDAFTKGFSDHKVGVLIIHKNGYVENLDYNFVGAVIEREYGLGDLYRSDSEFLGGWPWDR